MPPALEYTKMKNSGIEWIGAVPSHWNIRTLYQLVSQVKNKNSDLAEQNLLSLSYGKIKRKDINSTDGLLPASFDGYNIEAGDIVLRLTDLQNDKTSLRVGLATERGIITSAYITLHPFDIQHSKYLYYLLHTFDIKKGFYGMGAGVRQGLNYGEVKELRVVVPHQDELEALVSFIEEKCDSIDSIIEETKASMVEYRQWRISIINETVTRGLEKNSKMKSVSVGWIDEIPAGWEVKRLKDNYTFGKGLPITKADLIDEGAPVVSYGQIHAKSNTGTHMSDDLLRYVSKKFVDSHPSSILYNGDIVLADTSEDLDGMGNAVLMDRKEIVFAGYHTIIMRPEEVKISKYIAYLFKAEGFRAQLRSAASGIKVFSVTQRMLRNCTIILPPEEIRDEITSYLDEKCSAIDKIVAEKEQLIRELESYKQSLIYEVVTGKRKVV